MLKNILSGISFMSGMIGVAGIAGAIECGTGYLTSTVLIVVSIVSGIWAAYEDGTLRGGKKR